MKQEIEWLGATDENIDKLKTFQKLLLKCMVIVSGRENKFSVEAKYIGTSAADGHIFQYWDVVEGREVDLPGYVKAVAFAVNFWQSSKKTK